MKVICTRMGTETMQERISPDCAVTGAAADILERPATFLGARELPRTSIKASYRVRDAQLKLAVLGLRVQVTM